MGNNLTRREGQILALIGLGKTSREIAAALGISVHTVNNHRKSICKKLSLHTTGALVAFAAGGAARRAGQRA